MKKNNRKNRVLQNTFCIQKFEKLLKIQSIYGQEFEMQMYIISELNRLKIDFDFDRHGNIFFERGKSDKKICLCAHLDTVFEFSDKHKILNKNGIYTSPAGIGGDDKCGIYAILNILENTDFDLKGVFFSGEEVGCIGSSQMDLRFFENTSFLIGIDRRGKSDLILDYNLDLENPQNFLDFILPIAKKFQYKKTNGLITDVFEIQNRMENPVCAINVSCGFYLPHTKKEFINIFDLQNCINLICSILKSYDGVSEYFCKKQVFEFENTNNAYFCDGFIENISKCEQIEFCENCKEFEFCRLANDFGSTENRFFKDYYKKYFYF